MNRDSINGTWILSGTFALNSEIPIIGDEPKPNGVEEWLEGNSLETLAQLTPADGLKLTISSDGTFTEERVGAPQITWYDSEGVLESNVNPFNGAIQEAEGKFYLIADDIEPTGNLRYDDGDTKIADSLTVIDGDLIRTVSVVTDELYLDRILLRYKKE
jgi:hypothetical protein